MRWLVKYRNEVLDSVMTNHSMTSEEICDFAGVELAITQEDFEGMPENGKYNLDDLEIIDADSVKKLYYISTNGYDMIVSVDNDNNCRYLTETEDFPNITNMGMIEKTWEVREFLEMVEDDSSWADDCTYDQIFTDDVDIIAEIEKEN